MGFCDIKYSLFAVVSQICYISGMFKFLRKFKKPIDVAVLDRIPIRDLTKLNVRISFKGKIVDLNICNVTDVVADRLRTLLDGMTEAKLIVEPVDDVILDADRVVHPSENILYVTSREFNKEVADYVTENKLYGDGYWCGDLFPSKDAVGSKLAVTERINTMREEESVYSVACDIVHRVDTHRKTFENLKELVDKYQYLVPVIDHIKVNHSRDWSIGDIFITPEMMEGYMDAVRPVLDDDEAFGRLREWVIDTFRLHANGKPENVDYNKPTVPVPAPEDWKTRYYGTIKPEEERRERNREIISEIRGNIAEHESMNDANHMRLLQRLLSLSDADMEKVLSENSQKPGIKKRSIKERYKKIAESKGFKEAYEGKSLGEVMKIKD